MIDDISLTIWGRGYNKAVKWGNAKSIQINGLGDLYIKFSHNSIVCLLKDCFYMMEKTSIFAPSLRVI